MRGEGEGGGSSNLEVCNLTDPAIVYYYEI